MKKHNFKIGDKVKLKHPEQWSNPTQIGVVVSFDEYYILVSYNNGNAFWNNYPHLSREIERLVKVGEQLMFSFMERN